MTTLIIIFGLIVLLVLSGLIISKEMNIERNIVINKSVNEVYEYLKFMQHQDYFSVWNMTDPNMKKTHKGTDGTVGFLYTWDSEMKNVGAGEQQTTGIEDGKSIDYTVKFYRPMQNTGNIRFQITSLGEESSSVAWIFDSPSKFPMSLFSPIFKKMLGKDLLKGLNNLKGILEKQK